VLVPKLGEAFHGRGLALVERLEEGGLDRGTPAASATGRYAQCRRQQVFLGVDQVDQPPQACRGVFAEADVYVYAAGVVGASSGLSQVPDQGLYRFDVRLALVNASVAEGTAARSAGIRAA